MSSDFRSTRSSQISLSRRLFLKSSAAFGLSTVPMPAMIRHAQAATSTLPPNVPGFQRLFPTLSGAKHDVEDLRRLASGDGNALTGMTSAPEVIKDAKDQPKRNAEGHLVITATEETKLDDEENFGVPSGYTYLGQFVDHDLTLNPAGDFSRQGTDGLVNLRSARFDLDCLYGRGPADQPYLYQADGRRLVVGRSLHHGGVASRLHDHPRLNAGALIGDKRNDENVIVSQLHSAFREFHNMVANDHPEAGFDQLQRIVSHHYQWVLLTDFLPKLCGQEMMDAVLPGFGRDGKTGIVKTMRGITKELNVGQMPLEFSDAAYRMGHSMIRPAYRLHGRMHGTPQEQRDNPAIAGRRLIFAASKMGGLNGFREFPAEWAIDWNLYFEIDRKLDVSLIHEGAKRVQAAYKFDTSLTNPLAFLPEFSEVVRNGNLAKDENGQPKPRGGAFSNLALRNLLRGAQHGLPSGQDVSRAMGIDPIADRHLLVGKANVDGLSENKPITAYGDSFRNNAPLWFYILAEAQHVWAEKARAHTGSKSQRDAIISRLGPVGGRIVAETFVALMEQDQNSILHAGADWRPRYLKRGTFGMPEFMGAAGLA